jgi:hypothetical protein
MEERCFRLTQKDVGRMAHQLAVRNGIANPFTKGSEQAEKKWMRNFLKKELATRCPHSSRSLVRASKGLHSRRSFAVLLYF